MKIRFLILFIALVVDIYLELFYPEFATLILGVEIIIIFNLINHIKMKNYREIYEQMDKQEQKLVHKLLGLLVFCLIVPVGIFIFESISYVYAWYKLLTL